MDADLRVDWVTGGKVEGLTTVLCLLRGERVVGKALLTYT